MVCSYFEPVEIYSMNFISQIFHLLFLFSDFIKYKSGVNKYYYLRKKKEMLLFFEQTHTIF